MARALFWLREGFAGLSLMALVTVLAVRYGSLPARVKSPFNGGGGVDGLGSKDQLWLLAMVAGWLYVLMSLLNLMPVEAVNSWKPTSVEQRANMLATCKALMGWFKALLMTGLLFWVSRYLW